MLWKSCVVPVIVFIVLCTMNSAFRLSRFQLQRNSVWRPYGTQLFSSLGSDKSNVQLKFSPHSLFQEGAKFDELRISPPLLNALNKCGLTSPTEVQQKSFDKVLGGRDVLIGAETGSGKTLSYMIPLIQNCLDIDGCKEPSRYPSAVVLAPNKDLCRQIMTMTEGIFKELKESNNEISIGFSGNSTDHWPYGTNSPYFLVTTPAIFANFLRSKRLVKHELISAVKHIVLDEADMLLSGSPETDIQYIYECAKVARRQLIKAGDVLVHQQTLQTVLAAATLPSHGKKSVQNFVKLQFPRALEVKLFNLHKHHPCIQQEFIAATDDSPVSESTVQTIIQSIKDTLSKEVKRVEEVEQQSSAFKTDLWSNPDDDSNIIEKNLNFYNHSVMIFVNTAQMGRDLARTLSLDYNIESVEFHNMVPNRVKAENLKAFQEGTSRIMVCTDSAARGFDLPNVRHVIQAEFATNVVQHQHRVGRASRAGRIGYATNIYESLRKELVEMILRETKDLNAVITENEEDKEEIESEVASPSSGEVALPENSIEQSFSRRRGFRRSLKRAIKREKQQEVDELEDDNVGDKV